MHDPNSEYMFMAAVNTAKKPAPTDVTRNLELPGTQAWTTLASSLQLEGQDSLFPGPQRVWLDLTTYIFC